MRLFNCLALCTVAACSSGGTSGKKPAIDEEPVDDAGKPTKPRPDGAVERAPDGAVVAPRPDGGKDRPAPLARKKHLQWKRSGTLAADLSSALELPAEELCKEFGTVRCIEDVHLVPLGGYDVFVSGMLEGAPDPIVTTPTAMERVLLSACSRRVGLDLAGDKKSALFAALDLRAPAPAADSPQVHDFVTTLYRRLLSRDPSDEELAALATLAVDDKGAALAGDEFAKLACFTVGNLSEFIFF